MTSSETALKNCCCLANAKKEPVPLSNTHLRGRGSEQALFFSPPLLHMLLLSHPAIHLFVPGPNLWQRAQ